MLFDVDGTLLDVLANQERVWCAWAQRHGLDPAEVYRTAVMTRPVETFAAVAPGLDPEACLAALHEIEDEDARSGDYRAFPGVDGLLAGLPADAWALVTSNYAHRVRIRFAQVGLPVPAVVVDAASVRRGKPNPDGYLIAAQRLGRNPTECLVVEDGAAGIRAGLAAGMTVWAVNLGADVAAQEGAHRRYEHFQSAAGDIRKWVTAAA